MITIDSTFDNYFQLLEKASGGTITREEFADQMEATANELKALLKTGKAFEPQIQTKSLKGQKFYHLVSVKNMDYNFKYLAAFTFGEVCHYLGMEGELSLRFYQEKDYEAGSFDSGFTSRTGYYDKSNDGFINVNAAQNASEAIKTIIHETFHAYQHKTIGDFDVMDPQIERDAEIFENNFFVRLLPALMKMSR